MYGLKIHFDIGDCLPACGRRSMHTVTTADGTKVTCRACLKIASVGIQQEICTRQANIAKQVANTYGDLEPCRNCGSTEDLYDTLCGDCNESIAACRIPGNVTYGSRWPNLPVPPLHLSLDGRGMFCGATDTLHYEHPLTSAMELKDLVGEHWLSGVSYTVEPDIFGSANYMAFVLDGVTFIAIEDPEDGWRSSMKELIIGSFKLTNTFTPVKVFCYYKALEDVHEESDLLLCVTPSGQVVFEVGTVNTNDWYPYFVSSYHPEALGKLPFEE